MLSANEHSLFHVVSTQTIGLVTNISPILGCVILSLRVIATSLITLVVVTAIIVYMHANVVCIDGMTKPNTHPITLDQTTDASTLRRPGIAPAMQRFISMYMTFLL